MDVSQNHFPNPLELIHFTVDHFSIGNDLICGPRIFKRTNVYSLQATGYVRRCVIPPKETKSVDIFQRLNCCEVPKITFKEGNISSGFNCFNPCEQKSVN